MNEHAIEAETFLDRLKKYTSHSHTNLENLPVSLSIVNPAVTKKEYAQYLTLMYDVIKDAEQNIFPALQNIVTDLSERGKSAYIENDLKTLGVDKQGYQKPLSSGNNNFSAAFAMGIMYVIEGSTLGGRFILRNISEALGYGPDNGAQYFAGYGNATGSRWKNFLNILVQYEKESNYEKEIIDGAAFAFKEITRHFTENSPQ